jgi:hypothetical protein
MGIFKFALNDFVMLKMSAECGQVHGRAEYVDGSDNHYLVHYVAADGCYCERWLSESALDIQPPAG